MQMILWLLIHICFTAFLLLFAFWLTDYVQRWWLRNQRFSYILKNFYGKIVYLEIKLPKEIHKNPASMEIVFNAIYQTLGHKKDTIYRPRKKEEGKKEKWYVYRDAMRSEFFNKYIQGSVRMWSSLEIISEEGRIRFFVVTQQKNAEIFKAYTYSQFPGIEVIETEDYTEKFDYKNMNDTPLYVGRWSMKDSHMPIKTYVDYGLDKDPKEEYKIDPLTPLLEAMAAAGKGEHFWYQLLIRPTIFEDKWRNDTRNKIDEILGIKRAGENEKDEKGKEIKKGTILSQSKKMLDLLPFEKLQIEALQRNNEKNAFDTIVRMYYVVDKKAGGSFNLNKGVFTVVNAMKSFNKPGFSTFDFKTITLDGDFPFLDPKGIRSESTRGFWWYYAKMRCGFYFETDLADFNWKKFFYKWWVAGSYDWAMNHYGDLKAYLKPGYHNEQGDALDFVLTTEELATMWHFPGKAFGNTSGRVESIKSDPPRNLPI